MTTFPLPALQPIPLSDFREDFAADVDSACRLPDGTIWVHHADGSVTEFSGDPARTVEALLARFPECREPATP